MSTMSDGRDLLYREPHGLLCLCIGGCKSSRMMTTQTRTTTGIRASHAILWVLTAGRSARQAQAHLHILVLRKDWLHPSRRGGASKLGVLRAMMSGKKLSH